MADATKKDKEIEVKGMVRLYDTLKHLTTINTGSIVLLATFLEKIFQNPEWGILIGFSFGFLGLSLFLSVMDLFIISFNELRKDPGRALTSDYFVQNIMQISLGAYLAFFLGITTFVIFSLKNFY